MKSRPTIFLSGVSDEFGSFRNAVENEIEMKGSDDENHPDGSLSNSDSGMGAQLIATQWRRLNLSLWSRP